MQAILLDTRHFILVLFLGLSHAALAVEKDWAYHARRLTGFSETTQAESLRSLKKNTKIENELRDGLATYRRYLALDVISALSLSALLPDLFSLLPKDESGAVALTINTLLTSQSKDSIVQHYLRKIENLHRESLSLPTVIAILDFLGRLRHPIAENRLELLMRSPHYAIRSAVVYYARLFQQGRKDLAYPEIYRKGMTDPVPGLRQQAQIALAESRFELPEEKQGLWDRLGKWLSEIPPSRMPLGSPSPQIWIKPHLRESKQTDRTRERCQKKYTQFYRNPALTIRIVFGYKDARPSRFVGDRYEAILVGTYLAAPCTEGWGACGFEQSKTDPFLWTKTIAGPDGKPRTVRLHLVWSSVGPDDDANRKDPFQQVQSEEAKRQFLEGIQKNEVVFYNGHSRDGGGPDFAPPRMTENGHVEYSWYEKNQPGMHALVEKLKDDSALKLLGLFSCTSTKHFTEVVRKNKKDLALITSPKLLYYTDALKNLLGGLSALLRQECEADFNLALRAKAEVGDSHLRYFFD